MPQASLWVENAHAQPFAEYALSNLLAPLGWTVRLVGSPREATGTLFVSYGTTPPETTLPLLHIAASGFFDSGFGSPHSIPGGPLPWDGDLPVLFRSGPPGADWESREPSRVTTRIDVLAATFFLLSGYEEAVVFGKDAAGRMLALHGVSGREGFIDWPAVDVMRERLQGWLAHLHLPASRIDPWGTPFALAISHDLEPYHAVRALTRWRAARERRATIADHLTTWLTAEAEHQIRATYFLPVRHRNERLPLGRNTIRRAEAILAAGGEVAASLPPGRAAHHPKRALTRLEQGIGRPVRGVREPGWRWDAVTLNALLHVHGFDYDSSLGYPERPSFRAGTAWPFRLFDLGHRKPVDVWEVPVLASGPVWLASDQGRVLSALNRFGGLMALDWSTDEPLSEGAYAQFLQALRQDGIKAGGIAQLLTHYQAELPPTLF